MADFVNTIILESVPNIGGSGEKKCKFQTFLQRVQKSTSTHEEGRPKNQGWVVQKPINGKP